MYGSSGGYNTFIHSSVFAVVRCNTSGGLNKKTPPTRTHHAQQYYSSTTAAHTTPHPPTMYSSTALRTAGVREYVHAQLVAVSYWDFHVLTTPAKTRIEQARPRELLSTPLAHRVGLRRPIFRQRQQGRPCLVGMARSLGRGGSGGAWENHSLAGHTKTEVVLKI